MKILLATYWYLPHVGGVSTHINHLKQELERLGHEVDIFAHHPDMQKYYMPNNGRYLDKEKIKSPIYEKTLAYYKETMPQLDPWVIWREIERYSFEAAGTVFGLTKYDLIHTHDIVSTRALWRVKPKDVPLIATIHGCLATEHMIAGDITSLEGIRWEYVSAEEYYGGTSSDLTIVPSEWLKNIMVNDFNVPENHIKVIPYGMDFEKFTTENEDSSTLERPSEKKLIVCPARLVPVKGHEVLINALAQLQKTRTDWHCWLVGDGELRQQLEQQVQQLQLGEYITFLGNRNDVPSLLKQADIFVLPSLQDNLPFSIMEAQVTGTPLIVSDAGGIPEMVQHGTTGLLVPVGDSKALFTSLETLLSDDNLRDQLSTNAQKFGLKQWSLQTMMKRTLKIYNKYGRNQQ